MTIEEAVGIVLLIVCGACFYYMASVDHSRANDDEEE